MYSLGRGLGDAPTIPEARPPFLSRVLIAFLFCAVLVIVRSTSGCRCAERSSAFQRTTARVLRSRAVDVAQLGLITPVLTMLPNAHATWERDAGIDEVRRLAVVADRLGYHHLTCSEHIAIPTEIARTRGARYWDPLATFGYLATHTNRIRFATHVLVLGYHHPLEIAKRYGTLDQVSAGRVVLGVGVGSLQEEFELLHAEFVTRGERADDSIRALRAAFGAEYPTYDGPHFSFHDLIVDPHGLQTNVPIWIGGRTARSLRRAVELADGWAPFGLTATDVDAMLASARTSAAWSERSKPIEVWLQPDRPLDPIGEAHVAAAALGDLIGSGATGVNARVVHNSLAHYLEQIEALIAIAATVDVPSERGGHSAHRGSGETNT